MQNSVVLSLLGAALLAATVPGGDGSTESRASQALAECTAFAAAGANLLSPPTGYHRVGD